MLIGNDYGIIILMRKKIVNFLLSVVVISSLLCGCATEEVFTPSEDNFVVNSDNSISGLTVGSSFTDFCNVYNSYPLQILNADNTLATFVIPDFEKEPEATNPSTTLMASCFIVDGQAVMTEELINQTGQTADTLNAYLTSAEYLGKHSVLFRYVIFTFADGIITEIESDVLDYNNELM